MSEADTGRRNGVQSVTTGMRVLQALVELRQPATLSAVAQESAMPPPQAHRYLQSLIASGMARQDGATGRYDLGPAALRLGLAALVRTDAFALADRAIGGLSQEVGATIQISALGPAGPTVTRIYPGRPPVITSLRVGSVLPMLFSATGQVFASFVPETEVEALVAEDAEAAGLSAEEVAAIRTRVRTAGFAQDMGRLIPGLRATAFPIRDLQARAVLVATMIATDAIGYREGDHVVTELGRRCAAISTDLGWHPAE